ncbi:hypothetical protein [Kingella kingae]|uniref:hypothetical protein n=1 Tax=Kingella kingae TaxID=504 RepID=UPI000409BBA8|nr:hypothetical protein [Kingella kingae]
MTFPTFFNQAPTIQLRDPLAQFLGATASGIITYRYEDAVKLCGHSCPTVASAYLMTIRGIQALYGDEMPERGNISMQIRGKRNQGTTGVTASVATLLTGAATDLGFGGIGAAARFARRNLLQFAPDLSGEIVLRRQDTGASVSVAFNGQLVPFAPEMRDIMPLAVSGQADADTLARFGELWQARVQAILVEQVNHPELIVVQNI